MDLEQDYGVQVPGALQGTIDPGSTKTTFLDLPLEIRNMIWKNVVNEPQRIVVLFDRHPQVHLPNMLLSSATVTYDFTVRILGLPRPCLPLRKSRGSYSLMLATLESSNFSPVILFERVALISRS
jgi:hypothetical protein